MIFICLLIDIFIYLCFYVYMYVNIYSHFLFTSQLPDERFLLDNLTFLPGRQYT